MTDIKAKRDKSKDRNLIASINASRNNQGNKDPSGYKFNKNGATFKQDHSFGYFPYVSKRNKNIPGNGNGSN